jgi:hypothetical protein
MSQVSTAIDWVEKMYRVRHMLKVRQWVRHSTEEREDYIRLRDRLRVVRHGFESMGHGDVAFLSPFQIGSAEPGNRESLRRFHDYLKDLHKTLCTYGWQDEEIRKAFPAVAVLFSGMNAGPVADELSRHDDQLAKLVKTTRVWFYHAGRRLRAAEQRSQGLIAQ